MKENNMEDQDWETSCPAREDGVHCVCWYDGNACCDCEDPECYDETGLTPASREVYGAAQGCVPDYTFDD